MNRNFFEEALAFDVRHAFLNPAEFGTPMNVDGLDTVGIWDDAVAPAEGRYESAVETWGVHQLRRTLHVPSTGEGAVPLPARHADRRHPLDRRRCRGSTRAHQDQPVPQRELTLLKSASAMKIFRGRCASSRACPTASRRPCIRLLPRRCSISERSLSSIWHQVFLCRKMS